MRISTEIKDNSRGESYNLQYKLLQKEKDYIMWLEKVAIAIRSCHHRRRRSLLLDRDLERDLLRILSFALRSLSSLILLSLSLRSLSSRSLLSLSSLSRCSCRSLARSCRCFSLSASRARMRSCLSLTCIETIPFSGFDIGCKPAKYLTNCLISWEEVNIPGGSPIHVGHVLNHFNQY